MPLLLYTHALTHLNGSAICHACQIKSSQVFVFCIFCAAYCADMFFPPQTNWIFQFPVCQTLAMPTFKNFCVKLIQLIGRERRLLPFAGNWELLESWAKISGLPL